ncbi:MAG TPA: YciI family protein [Candidatus Limnocylindrales bacterium]|nr:YciI family protein [Candidatus Limnocylindrales bacterium]
MDDIPAAPAAPAPPASPLEPAWFVEATYAPDGAQTRTPFRAEHLARCRELLEAGTYIAVGAFADVSASVVIVRAPSEVAALAIVRDDVYLRNGVWVELRARAFGVVRRGS